MGRCLSIIKISGATSLGLLTGSLVYQTWEVIPQLIRELNNLATVAKQLSTLKGITSTFTISNIFHVASALVSSGLFYMAYKYSPPSGKHPYLVYSAVGPIMAIASLYYKGLGAQINFTHRAKGKKSGQCCSKLGLCVIKAKSLMGKKCCLTKGRKCCKKQEDSVPKTSETVESTTSETPAQTTNESTPIDEDHLGSSYIHVSEDLSSSTPTASVPGSPVPIAATTSASSAIEEEVENALNKKAYVQDLEVIKSGSLVASAFAAAGLFISAIGVVGERYYL